VALDYGDEVSRQGIFANPRAYDTKFRGMTFRNHPILFIHSCVFQNPQCSPQKTENGYYKKKVKKYASNSVKRKVNYFCHIKGKNCFSKLNEFEWRRDFEHLKI
jgi:hypothetical protein